MTENTRIRDAIKNASRLTRMRQGQLAFEYIEFDSLVGDSGDKVRLAQIPINESEAQRGIIEAANLGVADNYAGMTARNRAAMLSDVWHSLRDPSDLTKMAFESIEEMADALEPTEIDKGIDCLAMLMDYASPSIDGLSQEDLDDLKKAFAGTDWSALSGRRWAAVKQCCLTLVPELLQVKLSGSSSTDSSTTTSVEEESTRDVSRS